VNKVETTSLLSGEGHWLVVWIKQSFSQIHFTR